LRYLRLAKFAARECHIAISRLATMAMTWVRSSLIVVLLIASYWLAGSVLHDSFTDQSERVTLAALPGISSHAIAQRGTTFLITERVSYYRSADIALLRLVLVCCAINFVDDLVDV
jgi:hypothetical protein